MTTGLSLDIDEALAPQVEQKAGLVPLAPAPVNAELEKQASVVVAGGTPAAMECRSMLRDETKEQAKAYALKVVDGMLANPALLDDFGNAAVAKINALVRQMLDEAGRSANIPEIMQITRELDGKIRAFTGKYDGKALKGTQKQYLEWKTSVIGFFNKFRDILAMLLHDAKGVQSFLDSLVAKLEDKRAQLRNNVVMCNRLYAANEEAVGKLVSVIAVMEYIRDEAVARMEAINVDETTLDGRRRREERDAIAEFIQNLDVRIGEFKQRLFIAWATGPQVRNIRAISYGMAAKITLLINLTIPVFEQTIVQWVYLQQAAEAAAAGRAVADANNAALRAFASAGLDMVRTTAEEIQRPTTDPETIMIVAKSLVGQAEALASAYEHGIQARQQIEGAMMEGAAMIADASDKSAAKVVALVKGAQATFATPGTPDLPEFVLDNADSIFTTGKLKAATA